MWLGANTCGMPNGDTTPLYATPERASQHTKVKNARQRPPRAHTTNLGLPCFCTDLRFQRDRTYEYYSYPGGAARGQTQMSVLNSKQR